MSVRLLLLLLILPTASVALADPVVVVPAAQSLRQLSREEVTNIFLGRFRALPDGATAEPIDQPAGSALRGSFYRALVNKDAASIDAYWSRLHFSGKASPPLQVSDPGEVIRQLFSRPGAIAYLDRQQVDGRMRIVFEFKRGKSDETGAGP